MSSITDTIIAATPTWPQLIELVKVSSPTIVAAAVLYYGVQQNKWMRLHAGRQLRMEQKAQQIRMLDDRQKIIRIVGGVLARYNCELEQFSIILVHSRTI